MVGTVISNRQYLPHDVSKLKMSPSIARGTTIFRHTDKLSFVDWCDSNVVKVLYTEPAFVEQMSVIARRIQKSSRVEEITVPEIVKYYQRYMRGVDMA